MWRTNYPVPGDNRSPSCPVRPPCLCRSISSCLSTRHASSTRQPGISHHRSTFCLFKPAPTGRPVVSAVLCDPVRGCHYSLLPLGQISLLLAENPALGTLWEVLFVPAALLPDSAEPRAVGWPQGQRSEAAALETVFAQLPCWEKTAWKARFLALPPFSRAAGTLLRAGLVLTRPPKTCHPWGGCCAVPPTAVVAPEQAVPLLALTEAFPHSSPKTFAIPEAF